MNNPDAIQCISELASPFVSRQQMYEWTVRVEPPPVMTLQLLSPYALQEGSGLRQLGVPFAHLRLIFLLIIASRRTNYQSGFWAGSTVSTALLKHLAPLPSRDAELNSRYRLGESCNDIKYSVTVHELRGPLNRGILRGSCMGVSWRLVYGQLGQRAKLGGPCVSGYQRYGTLSDPQCIIPAWAMGICGTDTYILVFRERGLI